MRRATASRLAFSGLAPKWVENPTGGPAAARSMRPRAAAACSIDFAASRVAAAAVGRMKAGRCEGVERGEGGRGGCC